MAGDAEAADGAVAEAPVEPSPAAADASTSSSSLSNVLQVTFEDLLVTAEGEWIQSHRANLLNLWRLLKQGCTRHNESYLNNCSLAVFSSFVFRWTDTEEGGDDDTVSLGSVSSHNSAMQVAVE